MRFDDAVSLFLSNWPHEGPRRPSPDTVRTYSWHLRVLVRFAAAQGRHGLDDALQPQVLREAIQAQLDQARQHSTVHKGGEATANGMAQAARRLARWLLAEGVPVANLSAVRAPRTPERIQPRLQPLEFDALERATLHQLVDGAHIAPQIQVARDLALLYLLYDTGLRCGEVVSMSIDDIDFDRGCVWVRRGKGNKQRALSILDAGDPRGGRTLHLLAEWLRTREQTRHADEHARLWVSVPQGRPLSRPTLRRVLQALCLAAGLDANRPPHTFRRANFTEHYKNDPRSTELLRKRMGWAEGSPMISIYTRGAEVEIAAESPLPSLAAHGYATNAALDSGGIGSNVPFSGRRRLPIVASGAGSGRSRAAADPRRPYTADGDRAGSVSSRRSPRH